MIFLESRQRLESLLERREKKPQPVSPVVVTLPTLAEAFHSEVFSPLVKNSHFTEMEVQNFWGLLNLYDKLATDEFNLLPDYALLAFATIHTNVINNYYQVPEFREDGLARHYSLLTADYEIAQKICDRTGYLINVIDYFYVTKEKMTIERTGQFAKEDQIPSRLALIVAREILPTHKDCLDYLNRIEVVKILLENAHKV
jgi:hypothetical protein